MPRSRKGGSTVNGPSSTAGVSPTVIGGGYRTNVIPSEGTATIDTRLAPDEDAMKFLEMVKQVVNDPQVEVSYGPRDMRPPTPPMWRAPRPGAARQPA